MPAPAGLVSRRSFLASLGATLTVAGLGGCGPTATRKPARFRFLVVNDLHHASAECDLFLAQLVTQMRSHGPVDFCLIVGDLADKGQPGSFRAVRDAFAKLGAPVHTVPGNHDCDVEQNTRLYHEAFPGKLNYVFTHAEWQFIGLDSTHGNKWGDCQVQPATLEFLDATLPRLNRARPTVLFTHFPLVPGLNPRLPLTPTNAPDVVARFDGWDLRCAFTGHYHARTETPHGDGVLLTNACCARVRDNHDKTVPEGYLLCTAHLSGRLEREFVRFAPAELSAPNAPS